MEPWPGLGADCRCFSRDSPVLGFHTDQMWPHWDRSHRRDKPQLNLSNNSCSSPAAKGAEASSVLCPTNHPGPHHHLSLQGRASFLQL